VYGDIRKCKIRNWEQRSNNREDWMRSIKEAKAHIGLYSQLRRNFIKLTPHVRQDSLPARTNLASKCTL
jgi:hypothetical protein